MQKNNKNDKVSIIVPVYNVEQYLEECIESILSQTHTNLEIILVNDGSRDNSGKICDNYASKDKRIKVIHKENTGVSNTRNAGLEAATGEYICFSDADDYLMPDYVEYLLNLLKEHNADISLTRDMYTTFRPEETHNTNIKIFTGEEATIDILSYNIPIGVYCKMFKRELLGNDIRFCTNLFIGEGFNFNTTAFQKAKKVVVGHKRIYFYRRSNPSSATTKFSSKKWDNGLFAIQNIKNNLVIKTKKIYTALQYADWHTHCDALNFMILASAENENPEMYKKCMKVARKYALYSFKVKISLRERIRGIIILINPRIIAYLMKKRNEKYFK